MLKAFYLLQMIARLSSEPIHYFLAKQDKEVEEESGSSPPSTREASALLGPSAVPSSSSVYKGLASGLRSEADEPGRRTKISKLGKDPTVATDFLPDKDREEAEETLRNQLKKVREEAEEALRNQLKKVREEAEEALRNQLKKVREEAEEALRNQLKKVREEVEETLRSWWK
jgi:hypothetical protein